MGTSEFEEAWAVESEDENRRRADAQHVGDAILRERCRGLGLHEVIAVSPRDSIRRAVEVMVEGRVGCVLVIDEERLVGIFTERDVMTRIVHKGVVDVMLVVHFYEAVLATLAIVVWHAYATVWSPEVYPGNPSWITGFVPRGAAEDAASPDAQETTDGPAGEDGPP